MLYDLTIISGQRITVIVVVIVIDKWQTKNEISWYCLLRHLVDCLRSELYYLQAWINRNVLYFCGYIDHLSQFIAPLSGGQFQQLTRFIHSFRHTILVTSTRTSMVISHTAKWKMREEKEVTWYLASFSAGWS